MSVLSRRLGWTLVGISLLLLAITVCIFALQPDRFSAFTVMPIWLWGGVGVFLSITALYFLRARFALVTTVLWCVTVLIGADETSALWNWGNPPPLPGPPQAHEGKPVIRVATLNCCVFGYGDPSDDLAAWQPDIVLLQDAWPHQAARIAQKLYQGRGGFSFLGSNAVITRWKITRSISEPGTRSQQVTVQLPGNRSIEVVNVHLPSAATDLRLWRKSAWVRHRDNRFLRQRELELTGKILRVTTSFPNTPTLLGGDFNAPATDSVHRQLTPDFVNSFAAVGSGWGNTYQRRLPVVRIDHLYATPHFTPIRSRVVHTRHSDHRMVISDFGLR